MPSISDPMIYNDRLGSYRGPRWKGGGLKPHPLEKYDLKTKFRDEMFFVKKETKATI